MKYWNVYEHKGENLVWVAGIQAHTPQEALLTWVETHGDNYGQVVILPLGYASKHVAYGEPESTIR